MKRRASAHWEGNIKQGKGRLTTASGVLKDTPYSFSARFENGAGTNPEELVAAAHAGCFAMALSGQLEAAGMVATSLDVSAEISIDKVGDGFAVTSSHLTLTAKIPNADRAKFEQAVQTAKAGCPISKLLNAKITLDHKLES
jgi:lipoyl-dependent peroxiredoxin